MFFFFVLLLLRTLLYDNSSSHSLSLSLSFVPPFEYLSLAKALGERGANKLGETGEIKTAGVVE